MNNEETSPRPPSSPIEKGFGQGSIALARWAEEVFRPEDELLREVRERSARAGLPPIQVGRFDGLHLEVLARACGAKRAVEIGTLGGYSGVCLLRGLAPDGTLETFEFDAKHAAVAAETFERAGVAHRVRIHVGPALERLPEIEAQGPFDLVFIDADKVSYPDYLAWAERHLRVGGVVLCDNAFGWGGVVDPSAAGAQADGVRALVATNRHLGRSDRWRATMLPTEEGLAFAVKIK